ncbi:MAG: substrate-binding domain-containing protein [Fusobacteriaceae bacterium]|jgi:ribose transport system substrate-binding protein|nr:substrate-binding domain-containing protein [Fusobacteriaceae bacterium]
MRKIGYFIAAMTACLAFSTATLASGKAKSDKPLHFIVVPKVVHPWFDEVNKGAQEEAALLSEQLGRKVTVDFRAPTVGDVTEQNTVLSQSAATKPDGIAFDPVNWDSNKAVIEEIQAQGIPVIIFDAPSPKGSGLTAVGNDFAVQAAMASDYLAKLLDGKGKVAIMQGIPTAENHRERYEAHVAALKKYPGIEIVAEGIGNDNIQEAQSQAAGIIAANPDLAGFVCCDAAAPIGIANAIKEAGKVGKIKLVGLENLPDMLELIKDGSMQAASCTVPRVQGSMSVLMMWQASLGVKIPAIVDTGIDFVTPENVDEWIELMKE